jgi:hypothetical protein
MPAAIPGRALGSVAVLAALAAGGCGGGASHLSRSEFVERANAICARYEQKIRQATFGIEPGSDAQIVAAIDKAIPLIEKGNRELRALKPPTGLRDRFVHWLNVSDEEVAVTKRLRDALRRTDNQAAAAAMRQLQAKDAGQDELARKQLGLTRCASGSGASSG